MYVLMVVAVNFLIEDLHWFCGKRTLIDGDVYMRLNGGVDSRVVVLHFGIYWYWCVVG